MNTSRNQEFFYIFCKTDHKYLKMPFKSVSIQHERCNSQAQKINNETDFAKRSQYTSKHIARFLPSL